MVHLKNNAYIKLHIRKFDLKKKIEHFCLRFCESVHTSICESGRICDLRPVTFAEHKKLPNWLEASDKKCQYQKISKLGKKTKVLQHFA